MKVLIADDELIARKNVRILLEEQKDIEHIFEADSGETTLDLAWQHQPDIIFLDVQMPKGLGIDIVRELPNNSTIIFATAYDEYAVKAFEEEAVDYLLKPFDNRRFYQALDRARKRRLSGKKADTSSLPKDLFAASAEHNFRSQLVVRDPGRIRLVSVDEIAHITGAGNYVELHLQSGNSILHRETLMRLETHLDPTIFVRIHRSTIVRKALIRELRPNDKGDYYLILNNGTELTLSRRHRDKLSELLE